MKIRVALASALLLTMLSIVAAAQQAAALREVGDVPQRLSQSGLYINGTLEIDPRNRPFSPQYPLWSDGARKSRWVRLPAGATIDATDLDAWEFPAGTRFWKEFEFGGRKVETRMLSKAEGGSWVFATYVWNDAQTDALLAPAEGVPGVAEVAAGRRHTIPSIDDCRSCHDTQAADGSRTEVLGFTALQLSTDRDPDAPHAEPLAPDMVTTATLVADQMLSPVRPELTQRPPSIDAADARTRTVLGMLSANCGNCHNSVSSIATLGLNLRQPAYASREQVERTVHGLLRRTAKWQIPSAPPDTSTFVKPGDPALSAILVRMKSRRPSSQMPPVGTVLQDHQTIELVASWIQNLHAR